MNGALEGGILRAMLSLKLLKSNKPRELHMYCGKARSDKRRIK
jgi:hypothetical protein